MRYGFVLTAMLVSGCYVPPQDAGYGGYAQPGYPAGSEGYGYAQPGYGYPPGGYEATPYDPNYGYSGGAPTYIDNGVAVPLVLLGGSWGYYDQGRHWHRAPDDVSRHFDERRDEGHRREGPPPPFQQPPPGIAGGPNRGPPPSFQQPPPGIAGGPNRGPPPQFHQPPPGIAGEPNRGPPPFHQFQQPPSGAIPAAAPRPAPPPPPARPAPHQGGRDCPPGQRC